MTSFFGVPRAVQVSRGEPPDSRPYPPVPCPSPQGMPGQRSQQPQQQKFVRQWAEGHDEPAQPVPPFLRPTDSLPA